MSWRDGLPPDKVLTDSELLDMVNVAIVRPSTALDTRKILSGPRLETVTLERLLIHHATLTTEIERLQSKYAEWKSAAEDECSRRRLLGAEIERLQFMLDSDVRMTQLEQRVERAEQLSEKHAQLVAHFESELHAGHTLVPQSYHTVPSSYHQGPKRGWMICVRCQYQTPSVGYCKAHDILDTCWARPAQPKPCEPDRHRWHCPGGVLPAVGDLCQCGTDEWKWPEPPLLPLKES